MSAKETGPWCLCKNEKNKLIKFSLESVFSHESKVALMEQVEQGGYKVYLYYLCTSAPLINILRVRNRVINGGHEVAERQIVARYKKSLRLIRKAIAFTYRAFFFNNSGGGPDAFERIPYFAPTFTQAGNIHWEFPAGTCRPIWFSKKVKNR